MENGIKNSGQRYFNQVRGILTEINPHEKYCSITLKCGLGQPHDLNIMVQKSRFENDVIGKFSLGEKVTVKFYMASKKNKGNWYTKANLIEITKYTFIQPGQ